MFIASTTVNNEQNVNTFEIATDNAFSKSKATLKEMTQVTF